MLMGLKEGQEKMSKSDPDSAIFMEDSAEDVKRKIKKAYCPPEIVLKNPIMDYAKNIIFGYYGVMTVPAESGPVQYAEYSVLEADYLAGKVHPGDLKAAVTEALNRILEPVR
jgi:tyrosyl-tRNA synthetase